MGIPQITAIMGMCVAGGAYLPVMCDHILMTEGSGPVPGRTGAGAGGHRAAQLPRRTLGGAKTHAQISGTVDFREPNDESCLERIRSLVSVMGARPRAPLRLQTPQPPLYPAERDLRNLLPPIRPGSYDMREVHRAHCGWQRL